MRLSRLALYLALFAFVGREPAHATEIAPTPKMLADAREMNAADGRTTRGRSGSFTFETSTDTYFGAPMRRAATVVFVRGSRWVMSLALIDRPQRNAPSRTLVHG
jgi:hypothetical protein